MWSATPYSHPAIIYMHIFYANTPKLRAWDQVNSSTMVKGTESMVSKYLPPKLCTLNDKHEEYE